MLPLGDRTMPPIPPTTTTTNTTNTIINVPLSFRPCIHVSPDHSKPHNAPYPLPPPPPPPPDALFFIWHYCIGLSTTVRHTLATCTKITGIDFKNMPTREIENHRQFHTFSYTTGTLLFSRRTSQIIRKGVRPHYREVGFSPQHGDAVRM